MRRNDDPARFLAARCFGDHPVARLEFHLTRFEEVRLSGIEKANAGDAIRVTILKFDDLRVFTVTIAVSDLFAIFQAILETLARHRARFVDGSGHEGSRLPGIYRFGHCSTIVSIARRGRTFASRSDMQV